jgi:hypothetical protein
MGFPAKAEQIRAAEAELGRSLPREHFLRLSADNGGEIQGADDVWQLHPVWDATDRKRMGRTANHIVVETQSARERAGFPAGAVAIASNGTGDLLILLPSDERIYFWAHDTGERTPVDVDWNLPMSDGRRRDRPDVT